MSRSLRPRHLLEARIDQTFTLQHTLITRRQAEELGLSTSAIRRRLRSGQWIRVFPNVFRLRASPETKSQRWAAAALWAGPWAGASHRTALQVWGMQVECDFIEVATTERRGRVEGIRVRQLRRLPPCHLTWKDGIRVTKPERTLLDIAAFGDEALFVQALEFFFGKGLVGFKSIRAFLEDDSTRGIPGRRILSRALWERGRTARHLPGNFAEDVRMFMKREGLEFETRSNRGLSSSFLSQASTSSSRSQTAGLSDMSSPLRPSAPSLR
jgi:hypothetical protein